MCVSHINCPTPTPTQKKRHDLPHGTIVVAVFIPFGETNEIFDTYKTMSRHANAHPLVNAGFSFMVNQSNTGGNGGDGNSAVLSSATIADCRLIVGGITRGPFTCPKTTAALAGKPLAMATLTEVLPTLQAELLPPPPAVADPNFVIPDPAYRQSVGMYCTRAVVGRAPYRLLSVVIACVATSRI